MIFTVKNIAFLLLCFHLSLGSSGQDKRLLTAEEFIEQVRQYHPLARQANLVTELASADLLAARGSFDPVFEMTSQGKTLDGTNYYRYTNPELKIPTVGGISIKSGIENGGGQYLNSEKTRGVLTYTGVELSVLQGLLIDKRRAALQQAKIFVQQSEQDRQVMINDLMIDAYASYWEWVAAYQLYSIYTKYLDFAGKRRRLVSILYLNGDRAVADTIEASAQFQNYRLLQEDALLQLNNKVLELSLYLWSAEGEPYQLPSGFVPDTLQFQSSLILPDTAVLNQEITEMHPVIRSQTFKIQQLEIERRLKLQNLLPTLNLQANLLSKDYYQYENINSFYLDNNYKFGLHMKLPLLLRRERGEYRSIRLKIRSENLHLSQKSWQLQMKVRQYYNEASQLMKQLETAAEMDRNYKALLRVEELKFSQGESSLFLINSRENKALEIEEKIIALRAKYLKAVFAMQWAGGRLR